MLLAHLIFSIAIGAFALFRVFRDSSSYLRDCLQSQAASVSQSPSKTCKDGVKIVKGVTVTLFIVLWLFEICALWRVLSWSNQFGNEGSFFCCPGGCIIVSNYSKQLAEEKSVQGVVKDTEAW
jgi:hypothetical protein